MAEYIEREALMRRIKEIHCAECDSYHGARCRACWVDDTLDYIDSEQAADVAPVLRCRDCKYWGDEAGKLQHSDGVLFARCKVHNYLIDGRHTGWCPTENDFCSYGERKDGVD